MDGRIWILDGNIVFRQGFNIFPHSFGNVTSRNLRPVPDPRTFHLVEARIMTSVNGITTIDVRTNQVSVALISFESVCLVSTGVGTQDSIFVDVVCVCTTAAWVVYREA